MQRLEKNKITLCEMTLTCGEFEAFQMLSVLKKITKTKQNSKRPVCAHDILHLKRNRSPHIHTPPARHN
jgi:hypothetical protein